ncbi:hypothetical protein R6G99_09935, partial [Actinotignum timonense]|nr:hypothetical protein [Actinotignum timonense]
DDVVVMLWNVVWSREISFQYGSRPRWVHFLALRYDDAAQSARTSAMKFNAPVRIPDMAR